MEILLDTLKWSAVVGAAVLLMTALKPLLDRRYSPKWRYGAWLVLAVLLLAAPVQWEHLLPKTELAAPPVVIEVPQAEVSLSREEGVRLQRPAGTAAPRPGVPASPAERPAPRETVRTVSLDRALTALWLTGIALFGAYHLLGTFLFARRARRWSRRPSEETARLYAGVQQSMGLKKAPPLRVCERVNSPMMIGLLRPCLLLPAGDWDSRELGFILRHELTHYRRRDLWYKLVVLCANAVHWFNPLIYLLAREASADMELTCDGAVVSGADAEDRRAYSETLLASVRRRGGGGALTTHFYGGAGVMRERFRNILGQQGRKRGVLALALTLVLTLAAACTFGISQSNGPEDLTEEELAEWQEKLNSLEWNGFVTSMYTDVRYLFPETLFYNGAGISRSATEEERAALEASYDGIIDTDIQAFSVADIDQFLADHTGLTRADFAGSGYVSPWTASGKTWAELEPDSTYFLVHGDTNYTGVQVTGGRRDGDTLTLEVAAESGILGSGLPSGTLTLVDGKVTSFTAPLYTAAEKAAWELMETAESTCIQEAKEYLSKSLQFTDKYISSLYCAGSYEFDGKTFYPWHLEYRMKPDNMENVFLVGGMSEESGYVTETSSVGSPVLFFSMDKDGQITPEGTTWTADYQEEGLTMEEYIYCNLLLGMEMRGVLNGWPEIDTPFLESLHDGHETWTQDWQDVARSYLDKHLGVDDHEEWVTLRTFTAGPVLDHDEALVVRTVSGGRTITLLLAHVSYEVPDWGPLTFWQVCGELVEGESLDENGDAFLYRTRFLLTDQPDAPTMEVGLYGGKESYDCTVRTLTVSRDGTGIRSLSTREASAFVDGADNIEEVQLSQYNMDDWLILKDVNFDGYCDIGLQAATPAYNRPYYFWLYNPETGQYDFSFWILGPIVDIDAHNGILTCETHSGPTYYTEYYTYDENGALYLFRRDVEEMGDGGRTYTEDFDKAANDWRGGSYTELTEKELRSFEDYFNTPERNGLLRFPLRRWTTREEQKELTPYLSLIFYDHDGDAANMTPEEEEALGITLELDRQKLTTEYVIDYISENYLISPDEAAALLADNPNLTENQLGVYLPEYDAYYRQRGDTMFQEYDFTSGLRFSDGSVTLYSNSDVYVWENGGYTLQSGDALATVLLPSGEDGRWYVESNYLQLAR